MTKIQTIERIKDFFAIRMGGLHFIPGGIDIKYQKEKPCHPESIHVLVYLYPGYKQAFIDFDLQKSKYNKNLEYYLSMHTYFDRHFGDTLLMNEDDKFGSFILADMIMAFTEEEFRNSLIEIMLDYHSLE